MHGRTNSWRLSAVDGDAVAATVENPDLVAEAEQQERPIIYLSGEEVDGLIQQILDSPDEELVRAFVAE